MRFVDEYGVIKSGKAIFTSPAQVSQPILVELDPDQSGWSGRNKVKAIDIDPNKEYWWCVNTIDKAFALPNIGGWHACVDMERRVVNIGCKTIPFNKVPKAINGRYVYEQSTVWENDVTKKIAFNIELWSNYDITPYKGRLIDPTKIVTVYEARGSWAIEQDKLVVAHGKKVPILTDNKWFRHKKPQYSGFLYTGLVKDSEFWEKTGYATIPTFMEVDSGGEDIPMGNRSIVRVLGEEASKEKYFYVGEYLVPEDAPTWKGRWNAVIGPRFINIGCKKIPHKTALAMKPVGGYYHLDDYRLPQDQGDELKELLNDYLEQETI